MNTISRLAYINGIPEFVLRRKLKELMSEDELLRIENIKMDQIVKVFERSLTEGNQKFLGLKELSANNVTLYPVPYGNSLNLVA